MTSDALNAIVKAAVRLARMVNVRTRPFRVLDFAQKLVRSLQRCKWFSNKLVFLLCNVLHE